MVGQDLLNEVKVEAEICAQIENLTIKILKVEVLLDKPEGCEKEYQNALEQGTFTLNTPAICSLCVAVS